MSKVAGFSRGVTGGREAIEPRIGARQPREARRDRVQGTGHTSSGQHRVTGPDGETVTAADQQRARLDLAAWLEAEHRRGLERLAEYRLFGSAKRHAPDLVSDVITGIAEGRFRNLPDEECRALRFARGVVRRNAMHINRRERRSVSLSARGVVCDASNSWRRARSILVAGAVRRALVCLTPREREVIALHYFEDRTIAEIASASHTKQQSVKELLRRARRRLEQRLAHLKHDG